MSKVRKEAAFACLLLCCTAAGAWLGMHNQVGTQQFELPHGDLRPEPAHTASNLTVDPKDASCRVYEEVSAPVFKFALTNRGPRGLRILRVVPGCGCTAASLGSDQLGPGENTTLGVVYEALSLYGELPRRTIVIQTDEPGAEPVVCTVGGFRERRFTITPPSVQLGVVLIGSAPSRQVMVDAHGAEMQLTPEKMLVSSPWISAQLVRREPLPDGGTRLLLNVGLSKEIPAGKLDGRLFIPRIQDDGVGPVIPVTADVSGPLRLHPARAFAGLLKVGDRAEREVEVRPVAAGPTPSSQTVSVTGFGGCPPGVTLRSDKPGGARVIVAVDASRMAPGSFEHKLVIKAQLDDKPCELLLPVNGMVIP